MIYQENYNGYRITLDRTINKENGQPNGAWVYTVPEGKEKVAFYGEILRDDNCEDKHFDNEEDALAAAKEYIDSIKKDITDNK
jgi:hypothetical protein